MREDPHMRIASAVLFVSLGCSISLGAQNASSQKGAKGLFYDPTSAARITPRAPIKQPPLNPVSGGRGNVGGATTTAVNTNNTVVNTGLMYYVELIKPSG